MKVLLCLMALVGVALAGKCNQLQRMKVKQQWADLYVGAGGGTGDRQKEGLAIFRSIFKQNPDAKDLFKRLSPDDDTLPPFQAHIGRVMSGLDMCISVLDDEDVLNAELAHLHAQHVPRNIPAGAFDLFKTSLRKMVPSGLGRCYDDEAWSECFDVISHGITG